jgi:LexA-binding, inner membrane-associated putative hydrolase
MEQRQGGAMASYRGHLAFASVLGTAYGGLGIWYGSLDWGPAVLGAALTTVGGLLPDLDSDSGVPVRELFGGAATLIPLLLFSRLQAHFGLSLEQTLSVLIGVYLFIRYPLASAFKRYTVHRGMFHSLPALAIAGLGTYLVYHSPNQVLRIYLAGAVSLGFLSHLVLDELCSVDFNGIRIKLNKFAGSALKLRSHSYLATGITYLLLGGLIYLSMHDGTPAANNPLPRWGQTLQHAFSGQPKQP